MGIGILAFGFAGLCGLVSLAGVACQNEPQKKPVDYRRLYESINPKEF